MILLVVKNNFSTGMLRFVALSQICVFSKLKLRFSTSKKITYFITILTLLQWSGTELQYLCSMSVFEKSEKRFNLPLETNYIIILVDVNFLRRILESIPSKLRGYVDCAALLHFNGLQNCICIYTRFLSYFLNLEMLASSLLERKCNSF